MDEDEYKATYNELAAVRCEFEKALTNNLCKCSLSKHFWLADREGYACKFEENAAKCDELLKKVREKSRFLLKLQQTGGPLPHNMEIRVQAGGIEGLQKSLHPERIDQKVEDIADIVREALSVYGSMDELPYSKIVQSVAATKVRRRGKNKKQ